VGFCAIYEHFSGFEFFLLPGRVHARPLALPALGRAAGRRPSGKMIRRRKLLEMAQNPQRRVHALLAGWSARPAG